MALTPLRDDALQTVSDGYAVRLSLPWIRSLPLSSLVEPAVRIDDRPVPCRVVVGDRVIDPADLATETRWWYLQDRVVLRVTDAATPGIHEVSVSFRLAIPYLDGGPDGPLELPFRCARPLVADASSPSVSLDVGIAA